MLDTLVLGLEGINKRIDAGIEWQDEVHPSWLDEVNLDNLRMSSPYSCLIGQTRMNYFEFIRLGHATGEEMEARGLALPDSYDDNFSWDMLTEAWRERIETLRADRA
jgi:hypothetical protein